MERKRFSGKTPDLLQDTKAAASEAEKHRDRQSEVLFWTDRSTIESGRVAAGVSWRHQQM